MRLPTGPMCTELKNTFFGEKEILLLQYKQLLVTTTIGEFRTSKKLSLEKSFTEPHSPPKMSQKIHLFKCRKILL